MTELKNQLGSYERYINDIPKTIDPCGMCKHSGRKAEKEIAMETDRDYTYSECSECCWFYPSKFEVSV